LPDAVAVTFTAKAHEAAEASVAPVNEMEDEPAPAVITPLEHDPVKPFGVATTSPTGKVSLNAIPPSGARFGFVIVKLKAVIPFTAMLVGEKFFVITGGANTTIVAEAVDPVPPSVEEIGPVVLVLVPTVVPVTLSVITHDAFVGNVPPENVMLLPPSAAVSSASQVLVKPLGVDITRPEGRVSVKAIELATTVF
jgi:hypothetical protein